jgi:hypothetical protein
LRQARLEGKLSGTEPIPVNVSLQHPGEHPPNTLVDRAYDIKALHRQPRAAISAVSVPKEETRAMRTSGKTLDKI